MAATLRRQRASLFVWLFAALFPGSGRGFESDEHERMGNTAFIVALEYFKTLKTHGGSEKYAEARELLGTPGKYNAKQRDERERLSYGDIIACVDYFLTPEKMLADAWKGGRRSPDAPSLPAKGEKVLLVDDCHKVGPSFAQASHNNHSHFQQNLLMAFRIQHVAAISAARDDKSLFAGLVINAIADHYLQDFFAPGHIFTIRDQLTDVPATAVHDVWNQDGADFKPSNTERLRPVADFICGGKVESCKLREDVRTAELAGKRQDGEVAQALSAILAGKPVHLKGDGRLWDDDQERLRQRLLMLLIQSQSILDVLTEANSFREMAWKGTTVPTVAKIEFGEYLLRPDPDPAPIPFIAKNFILMASVHREAMIAGTRFGRTVFTFETPLAALPYKSLTLVPLVGAGYHYEGNLDGAGPTLRLAAAIPETELGFSVYVRNFTYPTTNEGDKRVFNWGLRLDSGFTSYFTTFISIGRDSAPTQEGNLRNGVIFAAGFQFAVPFSRIASKH
jgi:hypothetical protein